MQRWRQQQIDGYCRQQQLASESSAAVALSHAGEQVMQRQRQQQRQPVALGQSSLRLLCVSLARSFIILIVVLRRETRQDGTIRVRDRKRFEPPLQDELCVLLSALLAVSLSLS